MRLRALHLVAMVGWVVLLTSPATGLVRRVPSRYATINQALDDSTPGDSVLVAPGVYDQYETRLLGDGIWFSSVAFLRGDVTLVSEAGALATTLRMDDTVAARCARAFGEADDAHQGFSVTVPFRICMGSSTLGALAASFGIASSATSVRGLGSAVGGTKSDLEIWLPFREHQQHLQVRSTRLVEHSCWKLRVPELPQRRARAGFVPTPPRDGSNHRRCRFSENEKVNGVGGAIFVGRYTTATIEDCWFESNRSIGSPQRRARSGRGPTSTVVIRRNGSSQSAQYAGALNISAGTSDENTFWGVARSQQCRVVPLSFSRTPVSSRAT
jgi:hypothetical protein